MLPFSSHVNGYYDASDQVVHDLRRRAEAHFRRQEAERAAIHTVAEFEARRARIRASFMEAMGGLPEERTPLNPVCTGRIDRGRYVIEKVVYESLPEFYVTAALYVPKGIERPRPAVLFVCGHSDEGKAYPVYQAVAVDLAENGFVVLAMDPPGQGERFQYFDPETGRRIVGGCTVEHTYAGIPYLLAGASVGRHFIHDGIRGVDYLTTRPEVDASRIGLTGNSGGGTQSCLLMMSEPRFAAAVPCTFVMTLEGYLKTGQAQDAEQIVRGCMAFGPDHDDFLTAMAPKPVLVGAAAYDFFPIEGAMEAVRRAKEVYRLYGAEEKVDLHVAPTRHSYSPFLREAAVNWFRRRLMGEPGSFKTGTPETLPPAELNCTPRGQALDAYRGSRTVFDLNRARLEREAPKRPHLRHAAGYEAHRADMRITLLTALGIADEPRSAPIHPRVIREEVVEGYPVEHVFFFSAPDIVVTGAMVHPRTATPAMRTDLVLFEQGTNAIPEQRNFLEGLLREGRRVFVFDPRGIGAVEARPVNPRGLKDNYGTEYKLGCDALMLGLSTLGLRVFDVLRGLDYLRGRADVGSGPVGVYGLGFGGLLAYLAGALDDGWADVTVEDAFTSFREVAETRYYTRGFGMREVIWGALRRFDLVDLLPCIAPRPLRFVSPRDAHGNRASAATFRARFLDVAKEAGYLRDGWMPSVE
ncbi:MAG: hypothetical protein A3F84_13635 [Candidatus Handelsmanbacteria bacterium RIFCSPLOWO2_12_FULL_64_10]|uniref:Peptidase S9 prolyl oligopeptidase catalytic domain-containing protein n=1 Tax=Handelsmanbacteria sp. (strain RIFCSPLOWO2_12_FULL_64_10) TaxID=1817868 RepID=A0A1F6CNV0_HANXR|nr:MAG: hypothetical protein A3F84_13635 [Candidatus Handelsmanbacteria bacterium RIFCSPLOWO2_12_FULL_64_10]